MDRFVLHDPPYSPDDAAAQDEARRFGTTLRDLLRADRRAEALELWFRTTGMPDEMIEGMRGTPRWAVLTALAPTLAVGGESPPFVLEVGRRLAELLPVARHRVLEGQDHVMPPGILAPAVTEFLAG